MKFFGIVALGAAGSAFASASYSAGYEDQVVLSCNLKNTFEVEKFNHICDKHNFDLWKEGGVAGRSDVRIPRLFIEKFTSIFDCSIMVEDVEELIMDSNRQNLLAQQNANGTYPFFESFHNYYEIQEYVKNLAAKHSDIATWIPSIGRGREGRDIGVIRISNTTIAKKTIWVSGGIHAREWISPATVTFIIERLLEDRAYDPVVQDLLNRFEFAISPVINPDGYTYSHEVDRLWRKNRRPASQNGGLCAGVDLNRNFDNNWGGRGASGNPCASDYRGDAAASEPETQAIQNFVMTLNRRAAAIDYHAYGQLVLRSYGYTNKPHPEETKIKALGDLVAETIKKTSGKIYSSTTAYDLYPTTGSTDDWYTENAGFWGYTFELRDTGRYGFVMPNSELLPTAQENWEAFKAFGQFVDRERNV